MSRRGACLVLLFCLTAAVASRRREDPPAAALSDADTDPLPAGALARLGTLRWGHNSPLRSLAFSPDGRTVAVGYADGEIWLWEAATGAVRRRLPGHRGVIWSLAFSPDGLLLASSSAAPRSPGPHESRPWTGKAIGAVSGTKPPPASSHLGEFQRARPWPCLPCVRRPGNCV
jgi:hypothetical protein